MSNIRVCLVSVLWAATGIAQVEYAFPPLAGVPQDKELRSVKEVENTARKVLEAYADKKLAADGVLDVTKAPYNAKGDGATDNTAALQQAVKDARDGRLITYLPAGVYLVHDTVQCVQGDIGLPDPDTKRPKGAKRDNGTYFGEQVRTYQFPCILQGVSGTGRATLKLAPKSPGFGNPAKPKPLLLIWARGQTSRQGKSVHPGVSYNQRVIGLDLDLGGNAGAIGLDMQGAQGTGSEDIRIDARGAFAGLRGVPGSGGSTFGLTVEGGQYGIYAAGLGPYARMSGSQPSPLVVRATLTGQTVAAILCQVRGPFTLVGAVIRGAGIDCDGREALNNSGLNIIDSTIEARSGRPAVTSNRPVYLANTYFKGAATLIDFAGKAALSATAGSWTHVREYAAAPTGPFPAWVDGQRRADLRDIAPAPNAPPGDLQTRHPHPSSFPRWDEPGAVNVRQAPYLAKGDGRTDDAAALQRAISERDTVFLPKGVYKLSKPLQLRARSRLIGVALPHSVLSAMEGAPAFSNPATPNPLIDTADDAGASTLLSGITLDTASLDGAQSLRWRAGRASTVINLGYLRTPSVVIEGNGGGRWLEFSIHISDSQERAQRSDYRLILARGTREPLTFYRFNVEHGHSDFMAEFRDARNVTIYSLKGEAYRDTRPVLLARESRNFRIYGIGGILGFSTGSPPFIFRFQDCADFLVANEGHQLYPSFPEASSWSVLVDAAKAGEVKTPGSEYFVVYKRGAPAR
jgi:hypothetical protein